MSIQLQPKLTADIVPGGGGHQNGQPVNPSGIYPVFARANTPILVYQSINQYLFSELQYKIMLNNKYVYITSTNDI